MKWKQNRMEMEWRNFPRGKWNGKEMDWKWYGIYWLMIFGSVKNWNGMEWNIL